MTDLLIAGKFDKTVIQNALRTASGLKDIVVLTKIEDCLELSENTNWVTYYPDYNHRFPTFVSVDGMEFPKSALSALAKILKCDVAFELYSDSNPFVYSLINSSGEMSTFAFREQDIEPLK